MLIVKVGLIAIHVVPIQAVPPLAIKTSHHFFMILGLSRTKKNCKCKLQEMHDVIYSHNKNIPMLWVIELNQEKKINTSFGTMLVGSALSNQCGLIPPDYNIYCNLQDPKKM